MATNWILDNMAFNAEQRRFWKELYPDKCRGYSRRHRARQPTYRRKTVEQKTLDASFRREIREVCPIRRARILSLRKARQSYSRKTAITKIRDELRNRTRKAIKHGSRAGSAVRDLGCTIPEFLSYLESKFLPGMTWENYGTVWHRDHIIPLSAFDLSNREEFLKACHYTNFQPLWAKDNLSKSDRFIWE